MKHTINQNKRIIICDPIYDFIDLSHYTFIIKLIDTPFFQRLRRLSQLGVSVFVYPSAAHNRFNHSVGAMELFIRLFDHLYKKKIHKHDRLRKIGVASVLLHDIGHGPFSHTTESIFSFNHEALSRKIVENEMADILTHCDKNM